MNGVGDFGRSSSGKDYGRDNASQLTLDDEDERLPWLESGDDEDDQPRADSGRLLGLALIALVALLVIIGVIWWLGHRSADSSVLAHGETIEAPAGPYKTRPENPGGKEFAGTGDTSFKVGEGAITDSKLAATDPVKPSIDATQGADDGKSALGADETASVSGVGVQVGAYTSKEQAQAGWSTLYASNEALHGYKYRIVQGRADIGNVYRLQAVTGDVASAESLCVRLRAGGTACQVKR
jgi:hypothetical protein